MRFSLVLRYFFGLCFIAMALAGCSGDKRVQKQFGGEVMGTTYSVKVVAMQSYFDRNTEKETRLVKDVASVLELVDAQMSTYKNDSELSRFNRLEVGGAMSLSPDTISVLERSRQVYESTGGYFNPGVSALVNLWGFGPDKGRDTVPDDEAIQSALSLAEQFSYRLDASSGRVTKTRELKLDLSAIAKGYGVDLVAERLKKEKLLGFLVEVGGEIYASGMNSRGTPWVLGIEQPDTLSRKAFSTVSLSERAMATSGDYRNYFEKDGVRYSHMLDPKTGYPIRHKLASVSVIAENCADADALATALMAMGEEVGYQHALDNRLSAYFIYRSDNGFAVRYTPAFEPYLLQ